MTRVLLQALPSFLIHVSCVLHGTPLSVIKGALTPVTFRTCGRTVLSLTRSFNAALYLQIIALAILALPVISPEQSRVLSYDALPAEYTPHTTIKKIKWWI